MPSPLILASGSRYRRELLERLRLPFRVEIPNVDESPTAGEAPRDMAMRLARSKAAAVAQRFPEAWVIGSDQVAVCRDRILGKPGDASRCVEQLLFASGHTVSFLTAVCLTRGAESECHLDTTIVHFRELTESEVVHYVDQEKPFDCAGGFKVEGLGISLFERIDTQDRKSVV